jgi:2,5-diketo-D-gluconate reductase A
MYEAGGTGAHARPRRPCSTRGVPTIDLNDGYAIPQLGFGVFDTDPKETARAVSLALDVGYRHIDTAPMYGNEKAVGEAVRSFGLGRDAVFVTSKLDNAFHRPSDARAAFERTLSALRFDYVDLFLIHWPLPMRYGGDFESTWNTLEEFRREGRARSIGVSNFEVDHLQRLVAASDVVPAVNQIELHPYLGNRDVDAHGRAHGIATAAWSPMAHGEVLDDPTVAGVAARLGKSPAQVVLRWHIERSTVVCPKSTTPARIEENFQVFDFQLEPDDVERLDALDRGEAGRTGPHPDRFVTDAFAAGVD